MDINVSIVLDTTLTFVPWSASAFEQDVQTLDDQ